MHRDFAKKKKEAIKEAIKNAQNPVVQQDLLSQKVIGVISHPIMDASLLTDVVAAPARTPLQPRPQPIPFKNQYLGVPLPAPSAVANMVAGWSVSHAKEVYAELKKIFN